MKVQLALLSALVGSAAQTPTPRTDSPTGSPTGSPTKRPSTIPTKSPSTSPTRTMPQAVIAIPDEYTHIRTGQPNEAFEMDVLTNDVLFPQDFQFPLGPLQIKVPVVSPDDSSGSCLAIKNKKMIEYRPNAVFIGKTSCKYTACYVIEGQDEVCSNEVIVDITIEERGKLKIQMNSSKLG